jgi:hypothetical protein
MLFPCSLTYKRPSPLPFFLVGVGSNGQQRVEHQRRMATGIVRREWRDSVIPFFHTVIGDTPACSSPVALQMRDAIFEMRHLLISNGPSGMSPMTLSMVVRVHSYYLCILSLSCLTPE